MAIRISFLLIMLHILNDNNNNVFVSSERQPKFTTTRSRVNNLSPSKLKENNISRMPNNNDLIDYLIPIRRQRRLFNPLDRMRRNNSSRLTQPLMQVPSKKRQMYLTCFAIVFVWWVYDMNVAFVFLYLLSRISKYTTLIYNNWRISLGTLFYSYYYKWPLPQSFF